MGRHRTTPDADVLAATTRVISQVGPRQLTLAAVAAEAGLAPATLLQRFGSKRGLLLAVAQQGPAGMDQCFVAVRAAHPSPLAALFAVFEEMTRPASTPEAMANSLAFLQIDPTDPDFHRLAVESSRAMIAGFRAILDDAVAARQLVRCDTERLARLIHAASSGSLLTWAILRQGSAAGWLRQDMETLLAPFRRPSEKVRRRSIAFP